MTVDSRSCSIIIILAQKKPTLAPCCVQCTILLVLLFVFSFIFYDRNIYCPQTRAYFYAILFKETLREPLFSQFETVFQPKLPVYRFFDFHFSYDQPLSYFCCRDNIVGRLAGTSRVLGQRPKHIGVVSQSTMLKYVHPMICDNILTSKCRSDNNEKQK